MGEKVTSKEGKQEPNRHAAAYLKEFSRIEQEGGVVPIVRKARLVREMLTEGGVYGYLNSIGSQSYVDGKLHSRYDIGMAWLDDETRAKVIGNMVSNKEVLLVAVDMAKRSAEGEKVDYADLRSYGHTGVIDANGRLRVAAMTQYFGQVLRSYQHDPYGVSSDKFERLDPNEVTQLTGYFSEVMGYGSKGGLF